MFLCVSNTDQDFGFFNAGDTSREPGRDGRPMKTETISAPVWQLTDHTIQGAWKIPSEFAEPHIDSFHKDVIGANFQHTVQHPGRDVQSSVHIAKTSC
jgi:hypothetical protein